MIQLRYGKLAVALLLIPFVLEGCTTGKKGDGSASPNATPADAAKTLRYAINIEPPTLDPARLQDVYTYELLNHTFEGLTRLNEKSEPEPCLAEKWEVSPDKKTYTFHLRKGVKFHNGREVTADDIKYSFERTLSPDTQSPTAMTYLDSVVGAKELADGKRSDLPGVQVVDPTTVKITIDRPRAYFLRLMSYPTAFVVCREAVEKTNRKVELSSAVGTGPFLLADYQRGQKVVLKANPNYWEGPPKMETIEAIVLLDPETQYNNYLTGAVDLTGITVERYAQDRDAGKLQNEYRIFPAAWVIFLTMDQIRQPAFAKKEVRQAFLYAVDREQIIKTANKGVGTLANGILSPEMPMRGQDPPAIPYDPAKAKALLAAAGYPDGKGFPKLTLTIQEKWPAAEAIASIVRVNLRDNLGIEVTIQTREPGQFFQEEAKGSLEFTVSSWVADYPDPQDFLSILFHSKAPLNRGHYKNPEFDKLCEEADSSDDPKHRADLYGRANRILVEDAGCIPLHFMPIIRLIKPNVKGVRANICTLLPHSQVTK